MSCGIDLVALAIALPIWLAQVAAAKAAQKHGQQVRAAPVTTREQDAVIASTVMKERELLKSVLTDYGCEVRLEGKELLTNVEGATLSFVLGKEGNYDAWFTGDITEERAKEIVTEIQDMYTREVQSSTYNKVVKDAETKGYSLESEEMEEDNSIVLTYVIPE